jgi:hypothetical protein
MFGWTELKHGAAHVDAYLDRANDFLGAVLPMLAATPLAPYAPIVGLVRTIIQAVEQLTPELGAEDAPFLGDQKKLLAVELLWPVIEKKLGHSVDVGHLEALIEKVLEAMKAEAEPATD